MLHRHRRFWRKLAAILFDLREDGKYVVGTDSRRLSVVELGLESGKGAVDVNRQGIVPTAALQAIIRHLPPDDSQVKLAFTDHDFAIEFGDTLLRSRLVEGRFPKWEQVVPSREKWKVELELVPSIFGSCVRQAAIMADQESRGVDLSFHGGTLSFAAAAADVGDSMINIPVAYGEDETVRVRLDHRFLRDFLNVAGEPFVLRCESEAAPVLLGTDGFRHVVMPMAIEP